MKETTIGLLPLYLQLYDEVDPGKRPRVDKFYQTIADELEQRGLRVLTCPICRLKEEFEHAVDTFEASGAQSLVTLHLAYSPSLESADALAGTELPVIVCDTTPTHGYGPSQDPAELMFNHGIHGVQDMCNLLLRRGKPFQIEVGHWQKSDVLNRVALLAKAAGMASYLRSMRAGLIGQPFKGMGDFFVPAARLKESIGVQTIPLKPKQFKDLYATVAPGEIEKEKEADREHFLIDNLDDEIYELSLRTGLALQKWVDQEELGAISFNFGSITPDSALETVPFLRASKLMASGVGYGGEGDILTASLVGTLAQANPETSFTEMFCPDWQGDSIYLSHMGEFNYRLAEGKARLLEYDYRFSDTKNPIYAAGRFKPGQILLINLLPLGDPPGDSYRLIIAPATMIKVKGKDNMERSVHGWFKTEMPIEEFLGAYSRLGGTHHLALTYEPSVRLIKAFGQMMGWDTVILG